ncbi:MAG: hypothetical protein K2L05_04750 [Muribaculaceae bacterium]|nr:hypothetical protein [Muribaculaceae bacterium]
MKKLTVMLLAVLTLLPAAAVAQGDKGPGRGERKEWMKKLKALKHDFLIKELDLTENQRDEFFELYDAKEAERMAAEQKVKQAERNVRAKGEAAADADYDAAIKAQYRFNTEIASIESKYEASLRKVLTKRQLYKLRGTEHAFQRKLMEQCPPPPHKNSHKNKKKAE